MRPFFVPSSLVLALLVSTGCDEPVESFALTFDTSTVDTTLTLPRRSLVDVHFPAPGGLLELVIDCKPDEQVDVAGPSFLVSGPFTTSARRAGYERARVDVPAGAQRFQILGYDGPQSCSLHLAPAAAACGPMETFRSPNVDHNHVNPGDEPRSSWEPFPVSGDHYPVWAGWDRAYDLPIKKGYLLHDLEHGGVVLSYECLNALESDACTRATADLTAARAAFAERRSLLTPDPDQPLMYAARAWRWGYLAGCYDEAELMAFMQARFRKGREDIDSDAAPFDPTH